MNSEAYPLIHAAGTARELGREHGEQAAAKIRGFLDFLSSSMKLSRDSLRTRALRTREPLTHAIEIRRYLGRGFGSVIGLFDGDCLRRNGERRGGARGADILGRVKARMPRRQCKQRQLRLVLIGFRDCCAFGERVSHRGQRWRDVVD